MRQRDKVIAALVGVSLLAGFAFAATQAKTAGKKAAQGSAMKGVPTWEDAKAKIESQWNTGYTREKILSIEKKGEPQFTEEAGSSTTVWDWGWVTTIKGREGSYYRQTALVTVERANKTRARFTVAALYKLVGGQWVFAEMPVSGEVEELAGADAPAFPTDPEAVNIFTEAWKKTRPDFEVNSMAVAGKSVFHQYQGRYWLDYKLEVKVTGTRKGSREWFEKKFLCTPERYSSVLKWDAENKRWAADEKMISIINEARDCSPAN